MITVDFPSLHLAPGSCILDIGCGSGRHTAAAYNLKNASVIGADTNMNDLNQAHSRLQFHDQISAHGNGHWALAAADITCLPFQKACFDLVICSEVLEHIPHHVLAINEVVRVLKPGCNLVVSVPRRWPEAICWALSRPYHRDHIRIYNANHLIRLVESQGAVHWRTHHAHALHSPYWWLKCLLGLEQDHLLLVKLYHRFLIWDMMQKPRLTRLLERWLNPLMGKSMVLYFRKPQ